MFFLYKTAEVFKFYISFSFILLKNSNFNKIAIFY